MENHHMDSGSMMNTSNNRSPPFSSYEQTTDDSPEESTWTFYMQDFLCGTNEVDHEHHQQRSTDDVSDAFSSSGRKLQAAAAAFTSARSINGRQLSFKRRKHNTGDDLEDTASSPAHSPKVSTTVTHMNLLHLNQNDKDNIINNVSEGNINGRNSNINRTTDDDQAMSININVDYEDEDEKESELKKRGLCLVPVSTLRNYFV